MQKRKDKLTIYVHENLKDLFLKFLEINYIFTLRLGYNLEVLTFKSDQFVQIESGLGFSAKENKHLVKLSDFVMPGDNSLISSSFLFEMDGKKLFYTGDLGTREDLFLFRDKIVDYIITEISHVEIPDVYEAYKFYKPSKFFITHISDDIESELEEWYNSLSNDDKKRFIILKDRFSFEF